MNKLIEYIHEQIKQVISDKITENENININIINTCYYKQYNIIRFKRFLIHSCLIFSFQFLTVTNLKLQYLLLPMHPPLGISFTMFYLFGLNSLPGLIFGEILGLMTQQLPLNLIWMYSLSDIIGGISGAYLCQKIFFIDSNIVALNKTNFLQFVTKNWVFTCIASSVIKVLAVKYININNIVIKTLSIYAINLWIADLNAVLVIPTCICSWLYVALNNHKISTKPITYRCVMILIFFITFSSLLLLYKNPKLIYLIILAMLLGIYISYAYGYLLANLWLFIVSITYLTYFIIFQYQYLLQYGIQISMFISLGLLVYSITTLYISLVLSCYLPTKHNDRSA